MTKQYRTITNIMETINEYLLDLFQPHTIIETIKHQAANIYSDDWELRHIQAMCTACEYVSCTYPAMYKQIRSIHEEFMLKQADI